MYAHMFHSLLLWNRVIGQCCGRCVQGDYLWHRPHFLAHCVQGEEGKDVCFLQFA